MIVREKISISDTKSVSICVHLWLIHSPLSTACKGESAMKAAVCYAYDQPLVVEEGLP